MKDLTGMRFGCLVADRAEYRTGGTGRKYGGYVCVCDCGSSTWCRTEDLTHGKKTSCSHTCDAKLGRSLDAYLKNTKRNGECMEWQGPTVSGYGRVGGYPNQLYVHREVFRLVNGAEPEVVMHKCDNPLCVNPKHLVAGTHEENFADMRAKRRQAMGMRSHRAKLTDDQVRAIKNRYAQGEPIAAIAAVFGVARSSVGAICQGKSWKHID